MDWKIWMFVPYLMMGMAVFLSVMRKENFTGDEEAFLVIPLCFLVVVFWPAVIISRWL